MIRRAGLPRLGTREDDGRLLEIVDLRECPVRFQVLVRALLHPFLMCTVEEVHGDGELAAHEVQEDVTDVLALLRRRARNRGVGARPVSVVEQSSANEE